MAVVWMVEVQVQSRHKQKPSQMLREPQLEYMVATCPARRSGPNPAFCTVKSRKVVLVVQWALCSAVSVGLGLVGNTVRQKETARRDSQTERYSQT